LTDGANVAGGVGGGVGSFGLHNPARKMAQQVKKELKSVRRKNSATEGQIFEMYTALQARGFEMHDELGKLSVSMKRRRKDEEISVEFESHASSNDDDEEINVQLFDVVVRKADPTTLPFYIVCTCSVEPMKVLSVRTVKQGLETLDQGVYDGPQLEDKPQLIKGINRFLVERGIDASVFRFVKEYSRQRTRREIMFTLEGIAKAIEPSSP